METDLYSFIDIFKKEVRTENSYVQMEKIVIPIIQRDYAQGRRSPEVDRIRKRFIDSLYEAIVTKPITLDFIYGDIDEDGIMYPLDGQQRLTTLFLLHWYAAKKEGIAREDYDFLANFSYETRYSARDFCSQLIDFTPSLEIDISREIVDQHWFPLDWKKDPTIASMLVVLDAIDEKFQEVENIWDRLNDNAITFYFLALKNMGLTDELYIKMNSRGKPLTQFEHFKAELERKISLIDPQDAQRILRKIDREWTELLWPYRDENNIIDDEFLRYFKFICSIICYKDGESTQGKSSDEFDLIDQHFSGDQDMVKRNIEILENYFDCWCQLEEEPDEFLEKFIGHEHAQGKIKIESRYNIDIFKDCIKRFGYYSSRSRGFPLTRTIILYGVISYLQNKDHITEDEFIRRMRIINNLTMNSEYEVSDSENRSSGNRMPAILRQVDHIIGTGNIDTSIERNFLGLQLNEEMEKIAWLEEYPARAEDLFKLEDHNLLQGQIGIVGLENFQYFKRFEDLFKCDRDKIDCAMMAIDFYGQEERNQWRYQLGSASNDSSWRALFHKGGNENYDKTKTVLLELLAREEEIDNEMLDEISQEYIRVSEENSTYPWRYYYIKYPVFRPGGFGKYFNQDPEKNLYMLGVMTTRSKMSSNSYLPFLKEADPENLSRDSSGRRLIYKDYYIESSPRGFIKKSLEDDRELYELAIAQNEEGIDLENRIDKLKAYLNTGEDK